MATSTEEVSSRAGFYRLVQDYPGTLPVFDDSIFIPFSSRRVDPLFSVLFELVVVEFHRILSSTMPCMEVRASVDMPFKCSWTDFLCEHC